MSRVCIDCRLFNFEPGHISYQAYIAGEPSVIECDKDIFGIELDKIDLEEFRTILSKARTCPHYKEREDV